MTISEEQRIKLESMQIKGIRWMIWNNIERESIESRLLQLKGQSYTNDLDKFVNSQSRASLISLIEISPEIDATTIDFAYEKYRYGLKPGFTLFWAKGHQQTVVSKEMLETYLKSYTSEFKYDENAKYKGLEYISTVQFDDVYELTFSYLQRFNYINPDGEFTFIYMMKECFVWIGVEKNFIAINNMPDTLMLPLKQLFSRLFKSDITNIKITNGLLKKVFPEDKAKRVTRHSSNPPANQLEKITFADANLSEKRDCIPAGYDDYDVTNTQYSEEIDDVTTGTLGVNCNKGKLYLSKSLTSTQFRTWSIKRITDIIGFLQNASEITLENIVGFNMFSSSSWDGVKQSAIPFLNQIAFGIVACKKSGNNAYPVNLDLQKAHRELNKYFRTRVSHICGSCEEKAISTCPQCGSDLLSIPLKGPDKVICGHCGCVQEGSYSLTCESGHQSTFENISEIIELISNDDFINKIKETIALYYPECVLSNNEYITLDLNGLELHTSPHYEKLKPSDISEFSDIATHPLAMPVDKLEKVLFSLKEKCRNPTNELCAHCKEETPNKLSCILQLFSNFEGFTPQPHQGHEFGDVSFLAKLHGQNMTFLGIAKSVQGKNRKITKSSETGREIIQQTLDALSNSRTDIIGVIYPYLLDDQLKYLLYHQAKLANKRIVILDYDFMLRLTDGYLHKHDIAI